MTPPDPKIPAGEALSDARALIRDLVWCLERHPHTVPTQTPTLHAARDYLATPPATDAAASGAGATFEVDDRGLFCRHCGRSSVRHHRVNGVGNFCEPAAAPKVASDTPKRCPTCGDTSPLDECSDCGAYPTRKVASDTGAGLRTMLQEAHDTLHECTAVLRADDCRKVAAVMERIRDVLATPTDATDGATVASEAAGLREAAVLRSAVRRILARCEAVEDENSDQLEKEQTEASSGFLRGERSLAKSLRRELHDLNREALGTISPDLEVWISGNAGRAEAVKHGADTYGDDDLAEGSAA